MDTLLIVVAVIAVLVGVIMSYWDDLMIAWFEFRNGKMSSEMAMKMAHFHDAKANTHRDPIHAGIEYSIAAEYEKYAVRLEERADRKAKHKD